MSEPIRILIVEDVPTDARLAQREIRKVLDACEFQCVATRANYLTALEEFKPDLIVSDYNMPHFDGMSALKLALERVPLTPVIIWTGSLNEDTAVECMKAGAANYVIKENIKRLGPAVAHALEEKLEEKQVRLARQRAEEALRESEERYRILAENMSDTVWLMDMNLQTIYISPSVIRMRGYTLAELNALPLDQQMTPDSLTRVMELFAEALSPENLERPAPRTTYSVELEFYRKDGDKFWSENTFTLILDQDKQPINVLGAGRDITERKRAEESLRLKNLVFDASLEGNTCNV